MDVYDNRSYFLGAGITQLLLYGIFFLYPDENRLLKKNLLTGKYKTSNIIQLLFLNGFILFGFVLSILGSTKQPNQCSEFSKTKLIMTLTSILTTLVLLILLYTEWLENSTLGKIFAVIIMVIIAVMYGLYGLNYNDILCTDQFIENIFIGILSILFLGLAVYIFIRFRRKNLSAPKNQTLVPKKSV